MNANVNSTAKEIKTNSYVKKLLCASRTLVVVAEHLIS